MSAPAIECRGVGKDYADFRLHDIDLEVPEGAVMGFVGPNGAGKSTTLRMIMGLLRPDRGSVTVLGHAMPEQQVEAKRQIGFVSEDMRLYAGQTLRFHMDFVRSVYDTWDEPYAAELVRRFDLKPEQKTGRLSHGQRVKATLLLALARRPRLLVFDEPTTGLDPVARYEVLEEMMAILADESRTILFSSHNTLDVEQISDYITFIRDGRIVESRDKESFLDRWRRLRVELPEAAAVPELPETVEVRRTGRLAVLTTRAFGPELQAALQGAGASVLGVERMTLEEIFVAAVSRKGR